MGWRLQSSSALADEPEEASILLTDEEVTLVEELYHHNQKDNNDNLKNALLQALPTLPAKLIVKLRRRQADSSSISSSSDNVAVRTVAQQLDQLLQERLETAKETLLELLNAGEVRKLDSLIGKAAREGRLDVAFFNVLTTNLKHAAQEEEKSPDQTAPTTTTTTTSDSTATNDGDGSSSPATATAGRLQILQHVYTRCQEEIEKSIPPGMALLNKLLRTEQEAIRANLYRHYLTPQQNVIETPDSKVELKPIAGSASTLVKLDEFVQAIANAVLQIRTVENAGGTDHASAAAMVESCRQVAKEARIIIGECYGRESSELHTFEEGLQPVFRPASAESPYIQGES